MKTVTRELIICGGTEDKMGQGSTEPSDDYTSPYKNVNHQLGTGLFVPAIKRVQLVRHTVPYTSIISGDGCCNIKIYYNDHHCHNIMVSLAE
jgi:hypothetical protein